MKEESDYNEEFSGEKTYLKGLGFIGSSSGDSNTSMIDVKNGKIVRIRPLHYDWKYDKKHLNPWKMKAKGTTFEPTMKSLIPPYSLAYKNRVYSPNRILYPLKRVDWDPAGNRNIANRGISKYVRISWDEAIDIIVSEIKRMIDTYGPYAILAQADGHGETKFIHGPHGCQSKLLEMLGGYTLQIRNPDSWEGWYWGAKHAWGCEEVGQMEPVINAIPDIAKNSAQVLFWGCDPETAPWGFDGQMASRVCYWFNELGIKSIFISPDLNYGGAIHGDKWIPIKPGTDAALQLAIAYVWITEDAYDKEYVKTHSVGFDKFRQYVVGEEDGIPKTPQWAQEKTGIASRTIKALARAWAANATSIAHGNGGPTVRVPFSTENGRLEVLLLAMQGLGKPGVHQVKMIEWGRRNSQMTNPMPLGSMIPRLISIWSGGMNFSANPQAEAKKTSQVSITAQSGIPKQFIPKDLIHDALLNAPMSWYGNTLARSDVEDQFVKYTYPAEGCSEIHMIWTDSPCWITCWNDGNSFIKGLRSPKVEFILAQHPWMENDCLFADLILPVSTKFESETLNMDIMNGQFSLIFEEKQCIQPVGEAKSDYDIICLIAEKFGLLEEYNGGKSVKELMRFGFENSGIQKLMSYEEFSKKGYYMIPTDSQWEQYPAGLKKFYEDPENNRLSTPSGKIEFYSERLARHFPDDMERPPVPHWVEKGEGHDERTSSPRAKKYPLLVVSNHPRWRVHANHDDMTWLREIPTCKVQGPDGYKYEPLWINPGDAAARGIENGDVVMIYNERGGVLAGARVTERIMPGAVYIDHGARYDPVVPGELDRGGAINTITPHHTTSKNATGMVVSAFLVEVKRADLDELMQRYPQAFKRKYCTGAGLPLERVMVEK
ncbi:MAG: molybdopterin-dependent oxidoreductase [Dehalococcoidales bacterium]|nr:molybdopterin-dependent oxidoreductase [Dehalococcoidales bacterium]